MPSPTTAHAFQDLQAHLDGLHHHYELRFAGHPLLSRDPGLLRLLIRRATALHEAAQERSGPERDAFTTRCLERIAGYEFELAELLAAQEAAGPMGIPATHTVARAHFVLSRYHREFADEERDTRDPGLLRELRAELDGLATRLAAQRSEMTPAQAAAFADDLAWLRKNAVIFGEERAAILAAQAPTDVSTHVSILAELANKQFDRHDQHFAQQPLMSRRPGLLADMITNLEETRARMVALREVAPHAQHLDTNLTVVDKRLALWRDELASLERLHERAQAIERLDHLREAVDAELRLYNHAVVGRPASDATALVLLGTICDRLGELARQLAELCEAGSARPVDHAALAKARDARTTLTRAWLQLLAEATAAN